MVKWDEAYRAEGLTIIQLYSSCFDTMEKLREHAKKQGIAFPVALDPGGQTMKKYLRRPSFPVRYLVGADGKVAREWEPGSGVKPEDMESAIQEQLARRKK